MAIDPSRFHLVNVADTCSVWNVLSSARLYSAAKEARCDFCITTFVSYECLLKPRKSINATQQQLMDKLKKEQKNDAFSPHSCDIGDLQSIRVLENRKRLGKGELSSIAFAMKIGQAFITDDMKARKLAVESGHKLTQTTSHLFAWLIFTNKLGDSDVSTVISQHVNSGMHLQKHLNEANELALQCRLNNRQQAQFERNP